MGTRIDFIVILHDQEKKRFKVLYHFSSKYNSMFSQSCSFFTQSSLNLYSFSVWLNYFSIFTHFLLNHFSIFSHYFYSNFLNIYSFSFLFNFSQSLLIFFLILSKSFLIFFFTQFFISLWSSSDFYSIIYQTLLFFLFKINVFFQSLTPMLLLSFPCFIFFT